MRTPISVKDLELIALREIRSFPGGEYVCHVEVIPASADWSLHATVRDGADLNRIQHAAGAATFRLKHRYQLRTDW
ncbi:hypothetical protein FDV58_24110 [Bradyrhizobium elkanii]|uniref:Uncharacterized protein n=1 Tax=Bradyrhizobium elkanii TaxID=29448 RepID=A0A4U6RVZ7_BRAEL|nr:hypothetical protein [Bradyrhizobium sp. BR2003]TKV78800.1 hypothetical protein FDV58_24110 [Bradyrhizobium elkanii]